MCCLLTTYLPESPYIQQIMEVEEDDDIYASGAVENATNATKTSGSGAFLPQAANGQKPADLEEGEEEDGDEEEESDSVGPSDRHPLNTS